MLIKGEELTLNHYLKVKDLKELRKGIAISFEKKGLHMDRFVEVKYIDGYRITLTRYNLEEFCLAKDSFNQTQNIKNKLWFVNIGGYDPKQLSEQHEFGLFVSESRTKATLKAKQKFLRLSKNVHKDDVSRINKIDACQSISDIQGWKVLLTKDPQKRSQALIPDWYGFCRLAN